MKFRNCWRISAAVLTCLALSCLPLTTHSPNLRPGKQFGGVVGFEGVTEPPSEEEVNGIQDFYAGLMVSGTVVDSSTGWGAYMSIMWKLVAAQADLFVRAPRVTPLALDVGAGSVLFIGPLAGWLPYFQVGRRVTNDVYVFVTQGPTFVQRYQYGPDGHDRLWMSLFGVELPRGHIVQVGALLGRFSDHCTGSPVGCWRPPRYFAQWVVQAPFDLRLRRWW
jgi:hypothetical protein